MKCQNCGTENASTSKFCMNCGSPLKTVEAVDRTEALNGAEAVDGMEAVNGTEAVDSMETVNGTGAVDGMETVNGTEAVDGMETVNGTEAVDHTEKAADIMHTETAGQQVYSQNPDEGYSYGYQAGQSYSSQQNPGYGYQPGQQGQNCGGQQNPDEGYSYGYQAGQSYSSQQNPGYGYQPGQQNQTYGYGQGLNVPLKPMKKRGNGMGIASLVCGITGLVFCWVFIPAWILGPLAIIFGIIQCCTRRRKGLGITGSILGAAAIILSIVIFVWAVGEDTPADSGQSREINRQADENNGYNENNQNNEDNENKEHKDYKSENTDKPEENRQDVNRGAGSNTEKNSENAVSEVIGGIGSFSVPDDWVYDEYSSTDEVFVYIPASADPEYLSDYMLLQVLENDYTFDDVDELVKINKNELIRQYGVEPEDVIVYTQEDLDIPIIAYEFSAYDTDVDEEMEIWEYHVIGDGYQAIFSSVDYAYWYSGETAVKDCAYEAAKSYRPD